MDVTFVGGSGVEITGTLDLPAGPARASALLVHCFTPGPAGAQARFSSSLTARGIAVLAVDLAHAGGRSAAGTTLAGDVHDVLAAAHWMATGSGPGAPSLLVGHSLGGAAALAAADDLLGVLGVATIGAPAGETHIAPLLGHSGDGHRTVELGARTIAVGQRLLEDVVAAPEPHPAAGPHRALLVLHSPIDEVVGVENAREIFEAARHPKSFVALDGADHLLERHADADFAAAMVAAWAERYLPVVEDPDPVAAHTVRVTELSSVAGFAHVAETPAHTWVLDEPLDAGGGDTGPNPYETLLSALGACTSMTMRMYARRKGWDVGGTRVTLTHERQHAADCEACETTVGFIDHLHRVIELDPALSPEQRAALLVIADKCPVHRTLTHEVHVTTELSTESTTS